MGITLKFVRFQALLYKKLIDPGMYKIGDVARRMGLPTSTLYHYVEGHSTFPVDIIAGLYNATRDIEFLDFIINDTDMMLTKRVASDGGKTVTDETLEVVAANGGLVKQVVAALRDGKLNEEEKRTITNLINATQLELEDLRLCVNKTKGGNGYHDIIDARD